MTRREVVTVPILSIRPGESPRLDGEDQSHIVRLAETEGPLPPILVDRRTMRVIDGMHRHATSKSRGAVIAADTDDPLAAFWGSQP
jgi:hypothetical protein